MKKFVAKNNSFSNTRKLKSKDIFFLFGFFSLMEIYFTYTECKTKAVFLLAVIGIILLAEILCFSILVSKRYFEDYNNILKQTAVWGIVHSFAFGLVFVCSFGNSAIEKVFVFGCWLVLVAIELIILEVFRRKHLSKKQSEKEQFDETKFKKIFIPICFLFLLITVPIREVIFEFAPLVMSLCCVAFYANFFVAKDGTAQSVTEL